MARTLPQRQPQIRRHDFPPRTHLHVLSLLDVVDVRRDGRVRADAVSFHQPDELRLGEVRRRRRLPRDEPNRGDGNRRARGQRTQRIVLHAAPRHHRGPPRIRHRPTVHRETLPSDVQRRALTHVRAVGRDGRDETPRDEVVQPPRVSAPDVRLRRRRRRRDGRMIARVHAPSRAKPLPAVQQPARVFTDLRV